MKPGGKSSNAWLDIPLLLEAEEVGRINDWFEGVLWWNVWGPALVRGLGVLTCSGVGSLHKKEFKSKTSTILC